MWYTSIGLSLITKLDLRKKIPNIIYFYIPLYTVNIWENSVCLQLQYMFKGWGNHIKLNVRKLNIFNLNKLYGRTYHVYSLRNLENIKWCESKHVAVYSAQIFSCSNPCLRDTSKVKYIVSLKLLHVDKTKKLNWIHSRGIWPNECIQFQIKLSFCS